MKIIKNARILVFILHVSPHYDFSEDNVDSCSKSISSQSLLNFSYLNKCLRCFKILHQIPLHLSALQLKFGAVVSSKN